MSKRARLEFEIVVSETSFKNRLLTISVQNNLGILDPKIFLEEIENIFPQIIKKVNSFPCKINTSLVGHFVNPRNEDESDTIKFINTKNAIFLNVTDPIKWYHENVYETILKKICEFSERGSGLSLKEILRLEIKINKCSLFSIGGNSTYIKLPPEISKKRLVLTFFPMTNIAFVGPWLRAFKMLPEIVIWLVHIDIFQNS